MTRGEIVEELNQLLASEKNRSFELVLDEDGIKQEGNWWYVPVYPRIEKLSAFDFAPFLNEIEEVFKTQDTNILLVPATADSV